MAWLAVDKDWYNSEYIYSVEPINDGGFWYLPVDEHGNTIGDMIELPKGSIKKLIGRYLSWENNPVEYK